MKHVRSPLEPRKTPVQARSAHTVEAIRTACIRVLIDGGLQKLSTTRVAARAGVSVGSLYQYYPNKHALLAAVLEEHLRQVVEAVEAACLRVRGRSVSVMAATLVEAFFTAKFAQPDASRALYAVAAEVQGDALIARLTQRSQRALGEMLATASDRRYADPAPISFVLSTAVVGPVQALLAASAPAPVVASVRTQLTAMVSAYLLQAGSATDIAPEPR
jgi:AcrR family transcriptional regulator